MGEKSSQRELGRVEQFMLGLVAMFDYVHRLRVLRVKKVFEELENEYSPTFKLLHVAMDGMVTLIFISFCLSLFLSVCLSLPLKKCIHA